MIATGLQVLGMVLVIAGFALVGWWVGGVVLSVGAGMVVGGVLAMFVGVVLEGDD